MLQEVYIVMAWLKEGSEEEFIAGIFSTREKAEHFCQEEAYFDLGKNFEVEIRVWEVQ